MVPAGLTPDQQEMAASHLDWAIRLARRFGRRYPDLADEMESAALIGLCEAARSFDPARGNFKTIAVPRIKGAMSDMIRKWSPRGFGRSYQREKHGPAPHVGSIHAELHGGDGDDGPVLIADTLADGSLPVGWEAEYQDEVAGFARRLPRPFQEGFHALYARADCLTMEDTGRAAGLSRLRVSQINSQGIAYLRARFPDPEDTFMAANRLNGAAHGPESILPDVPDMVDGPPPPAPAPVPGPIGNCPDCGRPYPAKKRRCWICKPAGSLENARAARWARARAKAGPAAAHPVGRPARKPAPAPAPARDTLRVLNVAGVVLDALAPLDAADRRVVLDWVAARIAGQSGAP